MAKSARYIAFLAISAILLLIRPAANAQEQISGIADTPWPMYQHDAQHTGRSPFRGPVQSPEILWTKPLDNCYFSSISIAENNDLLISGSCLVRMDPTARHIIWRANSFGISTNSALVSEDYTIYRGYGNSFEQLSSQGSMNWTIELGPIYGFNSSPVFGTDNNLYFVFSGLWSYTTSGEYRWFWPYGLIGAHASPAIGLDGNIYAGTDYEGDICAYTSAGEISWFLDTPGVGFDRTMAVGNDGTIFLPTDTGNLVAVNPTGTTKWNFQPDEPNIDYVPDGIAIRPDGAIYFGLNMNSAESYFYSISSDGEFQWQVQFYGNPFTGMSATIGHPITVDRDGNAYLCSNNSKCYGIDSNGNVLWNIEFINIDSIITIAFTQPILAQDGLFYLVDNHSMLYAYADPGQIPFLRVSVESLDNTVELGTPVFTNTIPITSTVEPITYTATISPSVDWLSISQPGGVTPASLEVKYEPSQLGIGYYQTSILLDPTDPLLKELILQVDLHVDYHAGDNRSFLPAVKYLGQPDRIFFNSKWFVENQYASIKQDGTDRRAISRHMPTQIDALTYSPDGRKVALAVYINGKHQINIMDTETGEMLLEIVQPRRVYYPAWAPDSQRLSFISYMDDEYKGEVYVINLNGTGLTRLTNTTWGETDMAWSRDGTKIAIQVEQLWIFLMNSDGTDFHQLNIGNFRDYLISWSPDGRFLLLISQVDNLMSPYILGKYELAGGTYTYLSDYVIESNDDIRNVAKWSPDGNRIAYVAQEPDSEGDWDIFVINADGSGRQNLTHALYNEDSEPAWSPNSQWIAFSSRDDDVYDDPNYDIYVIRADGSELRLLTRNVQEDLHPFWKP